MRKKDKAEDIIPPDIKLYYKVTETMYGSSIKNGHIAHRNSKEGTHTYKGSLCQRNKNRQWRKDSLSQNGIGKTGQLCAR